MIAPYGSATLAPRIVSDPARKSALEKEAESLPDRVVTSAAAANLVMLGAGYFNPLEGFMNLADAVSVASDMKTSGGLFWPVPVVNRLEDVAGIEVGARIALRDPNREGHPILAVQTVEAVDTASDAQLQTMTEQVFGTTDGSHPGVETFLSHGPHFVSGPVEVLDYSYFDTEFPDTFRTAVEIRDEIGNAGGRRSSPSRPATRCTARTKSCARWPRRRCRPTACSSTCCWAA